MDPPLPAPGSRRADAKAGSPTLLDAPGKSMSLKAWIQTLFEPLLPGSVTRSYIDCPGKSERQTNDR